MTSKPNASSQAIHDRLESNIRLRARSQDNHAGNLLEDIDELRDAGWIAACLPEADGGRGWGCIPQATKEATGALWTLGRANLAVGRLFEGHMNAVKLVHLYAKRDQAQRLFEQVRNGALWGVWGANLPAGPVAINSAGDDAQLTNAKQFASGLGVVSQAVITIQVDEPGVGARTQLAIAPVDDKTRQDAEPWQMSGMRATRSGHFDFNGLELAECELLGEPDAYFREPYFEGGVWRYCAVQAGGAEALYEAYRNHLLTIDRDSDHFQRARIALCAEAVTTARLWVQHASLTVESTTPDPASAIQSLMARDVVEKCCLRIISETERGMGMAAHQIGSDTERMRRDLRLYLCQAAPDAKRQRIAEYHLNVDIDERGR